MSRLRYLLTRGWAGEAVILSSALIMVPFRIWTMVMIPKASVYTYYPWWMHLAVALAFSSQVVAVLRWRRALAWATALAFTACVVSAWLQFLGHAAAGNWVFWLSMAAVQGWTFWRIQEDHYERRGNGLPDRD